MTIAPHTAGVSASSIPVGMIIEYTFGDTIATPIGWLLCNGAAVPRSLYKRLFAVIGTTYGVGDGSTTFNLPNLSDRYLYGSNTTIGPGSGANMHTHGGTSFWFTLTGGGADGSDVTHTHNVSVGIVTAGVGSHTHNQNLGWNTGNVSGVNKAAGNTVALQGSVHDHNVAAGWNAATDSHTHNVNADGQTNAGGAALHVHEANSNLNTNVATSGNTNSSGSANHEPSGFISLFIIKT
jgi:hypothetical protein